MSRENVTGTLYAELERQGYRGKIVSIEHVSQLHKELDEQYQRGLFNEEFYREELTGFDFKPSAPFPQATSLLIVAAFQPKTRVTFTWDGKSLPCIIPPTYSHLTDNKVRDILDDQLRPKGYRLDEARLPLKLLAVRSGLAQYGRNNISYVDGMGSFHRLVAFFSDLPSLEDSWGELGVLERCGNCSACMKACPTGAIRSDRFLLHGERCLTFHNERQGDFPQWIDPSWHHCLVGCLHCQEVCPVNRDIFQMVDEGAAFSHTETAAVLQGLPRHKIPKETLGKLEEPGMIEYSDVLGRNLGVLIENRQQLSL